MTQEQKLKIAIDALERIKTWDEETDENWQDPQTFASAALDSLRL